MAERQDFKRTSLVPRDRSREPWLDPKLRQAKSKPLANAMRLLRTAAFGLTVAVIASATVAWHFSDDQTKEMLRGWGLS